ncbi:MAG: HPF/RaiA family ribosome-associated protein [Vicinamibacterales bacterium]
MRTFIRVSAGCPAPEGDLVRRRLEYALSRFESRINTLSVRLKDLNGPRGGVDKHCQITIRLEHPSRVIVVEDVDAELEVAVSRAADRAARSVTRAVQAAAQWRVVKRAAPLWR